MNQKIIFPNLKKFSELKRHSSFNLVNFSLPIVDFMNPVKSSPSQKYDNKYFLICLFDFLNNNVSWNKYKGTSDYPINGKYLNQIHNKFQKKGIYEQIEKELITKYLKTDKESKLKIQMIDSSFIPNKCGFTKKNNEMLSPEEKLQNEKIKKNNKKNKKERNFIDFNRYNGRKKYIKIVAITYSYGTCLCKSIISSKRADSDTLI
jgi:hypothetical protein